MRQWFLERQSIFFRFKYRDTTIARRTMRRMRIERPTVHLSVHLDCQLVYHFSARHSAATLNSGRHFAIVIRAIVVSSKCSASATYRFEYSMFLTLLTCPLNNLSFRLRFLASHNAMVVSSEHVANRFASKNLRQFTQSLWAFSTV